MHDQLYSKIKSERRMYILHPWSTNGDLVLHGRDEVLSSSVKIENTQDYKEDTRTTVMHKLSSDLQLMMQTTTGSEKL